MIAERTRRRDARAHAWLLAIAAAFLAHLAIVLLLGSAVPSAFGDEQPVHLHSHAPLVEDSDRAHDGAPSNLLLPPEVRSLGMHEHEWVAPLPAMPGITQLLGSPLIDIARLDTAIAAPDAPAHAGRAPPRT